MVNKVMHIWYGFVNEHGGEINLHTNIIRLWPDYLRLELVNEQTK